MIVAVDSRSAREAERAAVEAGVTLAELMRRAGTAVARETARLAPEGPLVVVTGKGMNGGDGWVAARVLLEDGRGPVTVLSLADPAALEEPALSAAREALSVGVQAVVGPERALLERTCGGAACVIDAVLGIGLSGAPSGAYAEAIDAMGAAPLVVSVDVPSGVDADGGRVPGSAVRADVTVTFGSPKIGLVLYPGADYAGRVEVAGIGLGPATAEGLPEIWSDEEYASLLPVLRPDIHKNERGRVLVVAGSLSYPGAAALAVLGAQRMGAGYVTLAVPDAILETMQAKLTSAVVVGLGDRARTFSSRHADAIVEMAADHDAVLLGPGMTLASGAVLLVRRLVAGIRRPLVADADALNALVDATGLLAERDAATVVTPHPGELGRLLGVSAQEVQGDRLSYGARLAEGQVTCVLKGARTVISGAGRQVLTLAGTPALATAGSGDVLGGMTATLLAQGVAPLGAGALAAHVHARAGERAAARLTARCVRAEDIPEAMPEAVAELEALAPERRSGTQDERR